MCREESLAGFREGSLGINRSDVSRRSMTRVCEVRMPRDVEGSHDKLFRKKGRGIVPKNLREEFQAYMLSLILILLQRLDRYSLRDIRESEL